MSRTRARVYTRDAAHHGWAPGIPVGIPPGGSRGSPPGGRALALASSRGAAGTKDARSRNFGFAKGFDDDARWGFSRCCFWAVLLLWQYVVVVCSGSMWCVVLHGGILSLPFWGNTMLCMWFFCCCVLCTRVLSLRVVCTMLLCWVFRGVVSALGVSLSC